MKKNQSILIISGIIIAMIVLTATIILIVLTVWFLSKKPTDTPTDVQTDTQTETPTETPTQTTSGEVNAIFLHHSTGENIWNGGVPEYFDDYNDNKGSDYRITELDFPSEEYGWENYPYDYWNIWVNHGDQSEYQGQPTLDTFTQDYEVIIWKHCFPVGYMEEDYGNGDITSSDKTLSNYKLQYDALKKKMHEYPDTKFVVWTGAALIQSETDGAQARRAQDFVDWVKNTWDNGGDNIYIFDFYELETEGELYMQDRYSDGDSHPNESFSAEAASKFAQRVIDIME